MKKEEMKMTEKTRTKTSNRYPRYGTHRTSHIVNETVHRIEVNHDELRTIVLNSIYKDHPDVPKQPTVKVAFMEDLWGSIRVVLTWVEKHDRLK